MKHFLVHHYSLNLTLKKDSGSHKGSVKLTVYGSRGSATFKLTEVKNKIGPGASLTELITTKIELGNMLKVNMTLHSCKNCGKNKAMIKPWTLGLQYLSHIDES